MDEIFSFCMKIYRINDFPYAYLNHSDPLLKNAITDIIYPNQVASGGMEPRFRWVYIIDPLNTYFGYVKEHHVGNIDPGTPAHLRAGGTYIYKYTPLFYSGATPATSVTRINVTDRRGTETSYTASRLGHILSENIAEQVTLRPSSPASNYEKTFRYNDDGNLEQRVDVFEGVSDVTYTDPCAPSCGVGIACIG